MDKKIIMGIAGAAILGVGALAFLSRGGGGATGAYTFETATVERGEVARIVSPAGTVQPLNKVDVGSEVSGKIIELYADFNTEVQKDQVLAQIDPETFESAVEQARARLLQSRASVANARSAIERSKVNLDVAEKTYNRQKALFAEQAISQAAWEQAEQQYKFAEVELRTNEVSLQSALAGVAQSEASLTEAALRLERTKIRSPIDGVVINRAVEVGQTVQSSMSVAQFFTIAQDLSQIQIEASVVEEDIGGVDPGDPVTFEVTAYPGETFRGVVSQVRRQGEESANVVTYTVIISARNPDGKLLPGMTATTDITADRVTDALRVTRTATTFTPPRDLLPETEQEGQQGGQSRRGPGGFPGGGEGRNPMTGVLTEMGVDDARVQKISADFQGVMQELRASMPRPDSGGGIGGGNFGPPRTIVMQQQMQEFRQKMTAAQDDILKRHLSSDEIVEFNRVRAAMNSQRRATAYAINAAGELEPRELVIGLSDGSSAQIVSGAEEGDVLVTRAIANKPD